MNGGDYVLGQPRVPTRECHSRLERRAHRAGVARTGECAILSHVRRERRHLRMRPRRRRFRPPRQACFIGANNWEVTFRPPLCALLWRSPFATQQAAVRSVPLLFSIRDNVREFFLLEETAKRSAVLPTARRESILEHYDAAHRRIAAARALGDPSDTPAGLVLYREACLALMRAIVLTRSRERDPDVASMNPIDLWEAVDRLVEDWSPIPLSEVEAVRETLVSRDPLAADRLTSAQSARRSAAFASMLRRLGGFIEPRGPREVKRTRWMRQAGAAVLAAVAAMALVAQLTRARNLALHRPVQSTATAYGTTPAGAVDGDLDGHFGFHSQEDDSPQLTIDLERPRAITEVKVFGRGDCCFDQSVPLVLEASTDGKSFRPLSERATDFSESDPWVVTLGPGVEARFVRLRVKHRGVLVLGEVAVYGKGWT